MKPRPDSRKSEQLCVQSVACKCKARLCPPFGHGEFFDARPRDIGLSRRRIPREGRRPRRHEHHRNNTHRGTQTEDRLHRHISFSRTCLTRPTDCLAILTMLSRYVGAKDMAASRLSIHPPPQILRIAQPISLAHSQLTIAASAIQSVRSLRIMRSGPERPDAAKGDQRSPDAMDLRLGIRAGRTMRTSLGMGFGPQRTTEGGKVDRLG
jgi:hypothetical protein